MMKNTNDLKKRKKRRRRRTPYPNIEDISER
jgi:hypothetical protein